jgi:hypothetical protein
MTSLACAVTFALAAAVPIPAVALERDRDPVVLYGSTLPDLLGTSPALIVAFRHPAEGWVQIPVQVDERAVVDFGTIYGTTPIGLSILTYTDTSTFTGPDPDLSFDADDELVLMAKDAAERSPGSTEPPGTLPGSGVELAITDPLTGDLAYAYLFASDGTLDPGAGANPVEYSFILLSGEYHSTYNTQQGPNPEDSQVSTAAYSVHFSDRWIRDETMVTAGGASGADILDRHKALFAPGVCTRSEETFSNGEGAFIVNRQGPVRALRGYVGANSGPTTYRIHTFYEEREDILTALRVHPIPGIMDYIDYSPAASGMVYHNDLNPGGVEIDGIPDQVTLGPIFWEMATGDQGTLAITGTIHTDIPGFSYTSYYSDDITPPSTQCTGDAFEYGASGIRITGGIPNTDPALGAFRVLEAIRVIAYGPPGQTSAFAEERALEATNPLEATAEPYLPATSVAGADVPRSGPALTLGPNPVRNQLRVTFTLPYGGPFALHLYDASGRAAATPVDGVWGRGTHVVWWDASRLPAGVYFANGRGGDALHRARVRIARVH